MKIILLTHERELHRPTNTGSLALELSGGMVERVLWQRTQPNLALVALLAKQEAVLLYPADKIAAASDCTSNHQLTELNTSTTNTIIILDGTWQETQKMYNKSDYLQRAPKLSLATRADSTFVLRRNQIDGGLCTIECIIELCKMQQQFELADTLLTAFVQFNRR